jgi:hypothetical protein
MAKTKGKSRREQIKERKEQEQAAIEQSEREAIKRRRILVGVPAVAIAVALGLYLNEGTRFAAGIALLAGFLVWLALALGALGKGVPARDRGRAGNIDYGKRG